MRARVVRGEGVVRRQTGQRVRAEEVDGARIARRDAAHCTCDIVGSHWLEKRIRHTHLFAVERNVGKLLQELEKLCRVDDGVRNRSFLDQVFLRDFGSKVAAFRKPVRSNDRKCDVMLYTRRRLIGEEVSR